MLKSIVTCVSLLLLAGAAVAPQAVAQVAVYGEFSGTDLTNLAGTDDAFGGTVGVVVDGANLGRHFILATNFQARFVDDSVESLNSGSVGARFEVPMRKGRLIPYGEFMLGFARYNKASAQISTTDFMIQFNGGVAKQVSPHWDAVVEFSYAQYYALGGQFNPKTVSIGAMYRFTKR